MSIIKNYVDKSTPEEILAYRRLVDSWNSMNNKKASNELIDYMFDLYAEIRIFEFSHNWDFIFADEINSNKDRYKLKKYDFFKNNNSNKYNIVS